MKKIIITLLLAALPVISFAQGTAFSKFQDVEGIEYLAINKDMFSMLGTMATSAGGEKTQKCIDMIDGLDNLRVFTTSERKHRKQIKEAVADYLASNPLEELISFSNEDSKIKIYVNKGGDASLIKEGLVFIEDIDDKGVVLVSFTGNVNLSQLKDLK
jgi:hypothetical protein